MTRNVAIRRRLNPTKLIEARLAAGITTQAEMAKRIGMTRMRYGYWERAQPPVKFDFHLMSALLQELNVSFDDISDVLEAG
ncbi:helix-turn-helix transcriptional regulator [Deinococcus multiflagellatus]|uniref:Helix-turn-helix transcriptional regulator n=1 Tax=Deinococcus multiflagellatus TaxID=1656887 RepID=A0ABW1ZR49_9DEIO|nr:helix-turn-helix transcriptional regulator [Deinococcus multiflagellatus]MBZ9715544.1 helix-turn-helix domain-containing protein [Deinococcus multiflagellatus]